MVDGLEDLDVKLLGLRGLKRQAKSKESISKALNTETNGPVTEVAAACLLNWVVVDFDDLVEVAGADLDDLVKLLEVELSALVIDKRGKGNGSQVADSDLIGRGVLNDLGAQVGAADGTKVFLVALPVGSIFVEHEGVTSLSLSLEDCVPQLLGTDSLAATTLLLVLLVEGDKLITVDISKARALVGAHECPLAVLLDTLHEEIGNPQSVEEIASTNLFLTVVLPQVEETEDVGVPGLKVDGESTRALVATLVDVAGSVVVDTEHRNKTIRGSVGSSDIRASGT